MDTALLLGGGIPFVFYLLILFIMRVRSRPVLVAGHWDNLLLATGLIGFIFAGPGRLVIPINTFMVWGGLTWGLLAVLYFLLVLFFTSLSNPFWVCYNINRDKCIEIIERLALEYQVDMKVLGPVIEISKKTNMGNNSDENLGNNKTEPKTSEEQNEQKESKGLVESSFPLYFTIVETPFFHNITLTLQNRKWPPEKQRFYQKAFIQELLQKR